MTASCRNWRIIVGPLMEGLRKRCLRCLNILQEGADAGVAGEWLFSGHWFFASITGAEGQAVVSQDFFDIYCGNSGIFSPVYLGNRNIIKLRREDKYMSENGTGLELLGFLGGTAKSKEAEAQKKLDQYEYLMEKGELLTDIRFTQEIKDKGLQAYDGDVQLIMPTEESTLYKGIFGSTYLLERCYNVKITKLDRETMTVYLSYRAAQAEYRPAALEKIKKSIEAGEELEVKAIVVLCRELQNYIVVDLLGLSIPGVLPFSEWIHGYAANIKEQAVSGKIIDVKIKGYTNKSTEEEPRFLVSRRDCVKSEWVGIEERFPLHSNIIIECVEMQGKNWIGKIPGVPNISVYCFYPNRLSPTTGGPIIIKIGGQYSCFVAAIDAEKCIFRARVKDMVDRS